MDYQEQYNRLKQNSISKLDIEIINSRNRNAWEYFKKIVNINNLERNILKPTNIYISSVKEIHNSSMVCWPFLDKTEIFIDEQVWKNYKDLSLIQIQHEILHGLSAHYKNGEKFKFGHSTKDKKYIGLDEATTQMFTENILGISLTKEQDYLYYIKNIMRILDVVFGSSLIADQYLNGNNVFEDKFNEFTNNKFEDFAVYINNIYLLDKKEFYNSITVEEKNKQEQLKKQVSLFISSIVNRINNPDIINNLKKQVDDEVLNSILNIQKVR